MFVSPRWQLVRQGGGWGVVFFLKLYLGGSKAVNCNTAPYRIIQPGPKLEQAASKAHGHDLHVFQKVI